jgi:hypothetical protein
MTLRVLGTRRGRAGALALVLVAAAPGCDEGTDPNLVVNVGVTQLALIDTGLRTQTVDVPLDGFTPTSDRVQVGQWQVESALLLLPENAVDLTFGEICRYTDSAASPTPVVAGKCLDGVVIEATSTPVQVSLRLRVRPLYARATPVPLAAGADYESDGVTDENDNCPLLPNPDQSDSDRNGIGEACQIAGLRDSDGDGVVDGADNCVSAWNPGQQNTTGIGTDANLTDGIGDACTEQVAAVTPQPIELLLGPTSLEQAFAAGTLLLVDFRSDESLEACFAEGQPSSACTLDPDSVRLCSSSSSLVFLTGCP